MKKIAQLLLNNVFLTFKLCIPNRTYNSIAFIAQEKIKVHE